MKRFFFAVIAAIALVGCTDEVDTSSRYVFEGKSISQYLEDKDYYSDYVRLLGKTPVSHTSKTTLLQLLSARGNYTVFAPTNEAIQLYLDSLYRKGIITDPSWDGFPKESVLDSIERVIVFNSILDCGDQSAYGISAFPLHEHEFGQTNMNDRKLRVFYGTYDPDSISIDGVSLISKKNRDIIATNGYIHQVEGVVAPSNGQLSDFLREWADKPQSGYSVMSRLILACGLEDTLSSYRDEGWERVVEQGIVQDLPKHTSFGQIGTIPLHRYYGFTLFAETDQFWERTLGHEAEKITIEEVCDYLRDTKLFDYVDGTLYDEDYTNEKNVLNQFVTYHLLPQRIGREKLVIHYNELAYNYFSAVRPTIPIMDYYQTMGIPRLLKTYESRESDGIYLNRFPVLKNGRGQFGPSQGNENSYHESGQFPAIRGGSTTPNENLGIKILFSSDVGTDASNIANAVVYPIDELLVCTQNVCNQMASQRIRIDAGCVMPELMNNDIRSHRQNYSYGATNCRGIPSNYPYLSNVEIREGTLFYYLPGFKCSWYNLQGDEYNVIGRYDFTMQLPPVPVAGQYEIRFGVATGSSVRSMAQVYFGTDRMMMPAVGIPMDLRMGGLEKRVGSSITASNVGWEEDTDDEEYNDQVTKRMRTKGFMKAPNSWSNEVGSSRSVRASHFITRRILINTYLKPHENYYIRFKSVLEEEAKEFFMDYFEYVAKEVYDNPYEQEDIW